MDEAGVYGPASSRASNAQTAAGGTAPYKAGRSRAARRSETLDDRRASALRRQARVGAAGASAAAAPFMLRVSPLEGRSVDGVSPLEGRRVRLPGVAAVALCGGEYAAADMRTREEQRGEACASGL